MIVAAKEIENNLEKFLDWVNKEDIIIKRDGKKIARLVMYRDNDDVGKDDSKSE